MNTSHTIKFDNKNNGHKIIIDLLKYIYYKINSCNKEIKFYESIEKIDTTIDIRVFKNVNLEVYGILRYII